MVIRIKARWCKSYGRHTPRLLEEELQVINFFHLLGLFRSLEWGGRGDGIWPSTYWNKWTSRGLSAGVDTSHWGEHWDHEGWRTVFITLEVLGMNARWPLRPQTTSHVSASYILMYYSWFLWRSWDGGWGPHQLPSPEDQLPLNQQDSTAAVESSRRVLNTIYDDFLSRCS